MPAFDIRDVNTVQPEGLNVKQMNEDVLSVISYQIIRQLSSETEADDVLFQIG